jgi:hypothetical protein
VKAELRSEPFKPSELAFRLPLGLPELAEALLFAPKISCENCLFVRAAFEDLDSGVPFVGAE